MRAACCRIDIAVAPANDNDSEQYLIFTTSSYYTVRKKEVYIGGGENIQIFTSVGAHGIVEKTPNRH